MGMEGVVLVVITAEDTAHYQNGLNKMVGLQ
jgi:hypothetical protein